MENFREADEGCSGLIWAGKTDSWLSGGSVGLFFSLNMNKEDQGFEGSEIAGDDAITAMSLHPSGDFIAIGSGESVTLRSFPEVKNVNTSHIARRHLPITEVQFTSSGQNM